MDEYIKRETVVNNLELLARHEDRFRQSVILGIVETIRTMETADVAPIEALERLRDELCAQDLITMEGLRKLNTLIWKYTTVHDGGADHEAD